MSKQRDIKILCVDDEPNMLFALSRFIRRHYEVSTATGGGEALEIMHRDGPFNVVVSDMQMPEMDGATFLKAVYERFPDTVRILLTGQASIEAAMAAVNNAHIFRFLQKPCPREVVLKTLQDAIEQQRLLTAEKVLLDQTLRGCIKTLSEVLGMANPIAFGRANRTYRLIQTYTQRMPEEQRWNMEVAAMLSQIGAVTLPPELLEKLYHGQDLTDAERDMAARMPEAAEKLLGNIPRMEGVREILRYQTKHFDGSGKPDDSITGKKIPVGARLLKVVWDYVVLETRGLEPDAIMHTLSERTGHYDPDMIRLIASHQEAAPKKTMRDVSLVQLRSGMVLAADITTTDGRLLMSQGQDVTTGMVERLYNMAKMVDIKEPVQVMV